MTAGAREDLTVTSRKRAAPRRWLHKPYLLPAEHGSWSWLLVPFLVGAAISGSWSVAIVFVLSGGLSAFLMRQPATAWLRIRRGRGRRRDEVVTASWTGFFALIAILSLVGLLLLERQPLLWLLPPMAVLLLIYLSVAQINRAQVRNLWMELAGAAGLAVMAPAAYVASKNVLDGTAWLLWVLMAAQNVLGVLYVRLRISDTHERDQARIPLLLGHIAGLLTVAAALGFVGATMLALVPFVFFLIRALWLARAPRPISNIKRFGFSEVGVELVAGLWLIFSFLLP